MAEILPPFVVHANPDELGLVGAAPGPAGTLAAPLLPGLVVELDAADPARFTALTLDLGSPLTEEGSELLDTLLGPGLAAQFLTARPGPPHRLGVRDSTMPSAASTALSELVLCTDLLDRPDTPYQALPLLRVAAFVAACDLGASADHLRPSHASLSASLAGLPPSKHLDALVARAAAHGLELPVHPRPAPRVVLTRSEPYREALAAALPAGINQGFVALDPGSVSYHAATASLTKEGNVSVRVFGGALVHDSLWARVRRVSDNVVIAAVPCGSEGSDLVALLLTPRHDDLVVDLVTHPDQLPLTPAPAASVRALAAGRAAARLERLDRPAAPLWQECARWHELAGDQLRAKLALVRATDPPPPSPPFLADLLL